MPADGSRESPKSIESEKALLGGLLLDSAQLDDIAEIVQPEDMYLPEHENLFRLLLDMRAKGVPIDLITVPEQVMAAGDVGRFGGVTYAIGLADSIPSTANLPHYAGHVVEARAKRQYLAALHDIEMAAQDRNRSADELREWAVQRLQRDGDTRPTDTWKHIGDIADRRVHHADAALKGDTPPQGVATRYHGLTGLIGRLRPGQLLILAARPAGGKSTLMRNICWDVGETNAVGIFTLEMGDDETAEATLAAHANVELRSFDNPKAFSGENWLALDQSVFEHRDRNIYVDDTPALKLRELIRRAKALHRRFVDTATPLGLIAIDYLQLIDNGGTVGRVQQVSEITGALKGLAKTLRIPVLALSQLNRAAENEEPTLSHLRESGSIEQDADVVMFLHPEGKTDTINVLVKKQRKGPTGATPLFFNKGKARFENIPLPEAKPRTVDAPLLNAGATE